MFVKFALALFMGLGGSNISNPSTHPCSRARARGVASDHLSEFFSSAPHGRRPSLFQRDWLDLSTGERKRATQVELREAYRLWAVHRDIRLGLVDETDTT
jgi:hypothetical protein